LPARSESGGAIEEIDAGVMLITWPCGQRLEEIRLLVSRGVPFNRPAWMTQARIDDGEAKQCTCW
jgi:hypothetical protein